MFILSDISFNTGYIGDIVVWLMFNLKVELKIELKLKVELREMREAVAQTEVEGDASSL